MSESKRLLRELQQNRCAIRDFFLLICPHVDQSNVREICNEIPPDDLVHFLRLVTYHKSNGQIYEMGSTNGPQTLDSRFFTGLQILREHFNQNGPLQFGDHLLLERERLRSILGRLELDNDLVNNETRTKYTNELSLIESLLESNSPETLALFLGN